MSNKPLLLLDVDGVLNVFPRAGLTFDWALEPPTWMGPFELTTSKEMGRALMDLGCSIEWLTTWCKVEDKANPHISPLLGFGHLPCNPSLTPERFGSFGTWWKLEVVRKIRSEQPDRPIIWVDDDLAETIRSKEFARDRNMLMICPDGEIGITRAHIALMRDFLGLD